MFRFIWRNHDSSKLENIVLIFFSIIALRIFSFIMCLEDLKFRLPHHVVPVSYVLQLHPDFSTEMFNGEVTMAINILDQKRFIAMHSKHLTITTVRLSRVKRDNETSVIIGDLMIENVYSIDSFDMLVIKTKEIMSIGKYKLQINFNGLMSNKNTGFFTMNYTDSTGGIRKIATTRFEPTYARQAFPCFDEPGFKATFNISLVQPSKGYHSLSNMPARHIVSGAPLPGLTTVHFEESPPISTYLVGVLISDFDNQTATIASRWKKSNIISLSAWTSMEKMFSLDFVLHMIYRSMNLYMNRFRINYPLPKIDVVAIPGYLLGPTENWGLILHEETSMLYFSRSHSVNDLKFSANRITYGLIQMWFGSLVTMNWWNDAWLVKSFATYIQYYTTDWAFPDWKEMESFLIDTKFPSMTKDCLISYPPIAKLINSPENIDQLFNLGSQKKGASILRMLHHLMGEREFFRGVASYLTIYQFSTAVMDNFVTSLQKFHTGKENLTLFIDTWIKQSGFPVLNVERLDGAYVIDQSRFVSNTVSAYNSLDSPYLYQWDIPILYTTSANKSIKRVYLSHKSKKVKLLVDKQVTWVKLNSNSIGHYTVNYDLKTWGVFLGILKYKPQEFRKADRVDLINDAFMNADAGRIPYHIPLSMLECIAFEMDYSSWQLLSDKLLWIHAMLRGTKILKQFEAFVIKWIGPVYFSVGWNQLPYNTFEISRLRLVILKMACAIGMRKCIEEVTHRFRFWISNPNVRPHPDIKEIIYYYGMLNAGEEYDWNIVYDLFVVEPDLLERRKLMTCLTAIQNSTILTKYLEMAKDTGVMSNAEYLMMFRAATLSPLGPTILWNFYKKNWAFLKSKYPNDDKEFVGLIVPVTSKFRTTHRYYEIVHFFDEHPYDEHNVGTTIETLEIVRNNIVWMESNYLPIKSWLEYSDK